MCQGFPIDEQSVASIIDASPDSMLLVNSEGEICYANARVEELFGYAPDELIGEEIEKLVPEGVSETHITEREAYFQNPQARPMGAEIELFGRHKDGTLLPVDISLGPLESRGEKYVMAAVRDIDDQKALRAKYKTVLEAVPDAVVVAAVSSGEIVDANEQVYELLGYKPRELIGEPQNILHPSDEITRYRELFTNHVDSDRAIIDQLPDGSDVYVETKNRVKIPVEINAQVFKLGDQQLVAGVFRDVTTRKERQQALEGLLAATRDLFAAEGAEEVATLTSETATQVCDLPINGVHLHDPTTSALVPVAWSNEVETIFDGTPPSISKGEGLAWEAFETGTPEIHSNIPEEDGVMNEDTPFLSELYLPLGEHGVLLLSSPVADGFDETDVALAQVLAANAQVALARVEREQQLESQNERLENFASILSHDLRNPLNVVSGRLGLEREQNDSEHLLKAEQALERMETLIDDMWTQTRHGQPLAETEVVTLSSVTNRCWEVIDTSEATLTIESDLSFHADSSRLQQLLENLIRNAIEHGGRDVEIRVGGLDDRAGFFVADDGPGVPAGTREQVFTPGYTTGEVGTGLGLAIVREIADAHHWEINVTDSDDGGAQFVITDVQVTQ
ncbi:PAS domain S-box protein [Haloferax sp. MBLA0076]|uniref:histidine kinase n=1 Tax=Haloferax litoreum TaxID=2666140 RepID=A0A6A8GJP8_9EURY|nr:MULTISPECIES: PAS domain S-box protein [Haloferax]KAB1190508.1 PAS domain S-box protein [Haloferax sp. CBA1148]MRX23488.1 PAS domain S-box protein [Haloferax litoreum]